jgi:hypothetical protein
MINYEGRFYNDDRLFILDLSQATKGKERIWVVVTRRKYKGFPPYRVDEFNTKEDAIAFIKRIEPTTPLISFEGKSPRKPLEYAEYCAELKRLGIPSSLEIYEMNIENRRELIVEQISGEEYESLFLQDNERK